MDKKGFLLAEETLKLILGVIAIGFLVFLLTSVYFNVKSNEDLEFAEASLDRIISASNAGEQEIEIYNPEGWWILSNEAKGEICICEEKNYNSCQEEGICKASDFTLRKSVEIKNPPVRLSADFNAGEISKI